METKFGKPVESQGKTKGPSFWAWNGRKLPILVAVSYVPVAVFVLLAADEHNRWSRSSLEVVAVLGSCVFLVGALIPLGMFLGIASLVKPSNTWNIAPLFDSGFYFRPDVYSWFWPSTPLIHGTIMGFNTIVSYTPPDEDTIACIHFLFHPVYGWPPDEERERKLDVEINRENESAGVVQIVKQYLQQLIDEGYKNRARSINNL